MEISADSPIFLDTNILIYQSIAESPFYRQAAQKVASLEKQGFPLWISRQVLREYLATLTRPGVFTEPIPISSLAEQIRYFEQHLNVAEDSARITFFLLSLMEQVKIGGKQVHDANIVATMQAYQIPYLLTANIGDFKRFSTLDYAVTFRRVVVQEKVMGIAVRHLEGV